MLVIDQRYQPIIAAARPVKPGCWYPDAELALTSPFARSRHYLRFAARVAFALKYSVDIEGEQKISDTQFAQWRHHLPRPLPSTQLVLQSQPRDVIYPAIAGKTTRA